jgi:SAM-dependent methyltransferase
MTAAHRGFRDGENGAFDARASSYDADFTATALGTVLRQLVWRRFDALFAGRRRVLDLGCGTGEDAVHLANRGASVLAIDASPQMVRVAAEKARRAGCTPRAEFRCLPIERAGELDAPFDAVCSNFGAVNCVREVADAVAGLARIVTPGAPLVWVVMGRDALWEWAWHLGRGQWRTAFRRRRQEGVEWRGMRISYPTPRQLARVLHPYFETVGCRPLGIALPPSYASAWLARAPRMFAVLTRLEQALNGWEALAAFADHYILEARRTRERPA